MIELLTDRTPLTPRLERALNEGRQLDAALLRALLGQREEAAAALSEVKAEDGETTLAAALLALWAGEPMRALVAADRAPESPMSRALGAEALLALGRFEEARARLREEDLSHPYGQLVSAWLYRLDGDPAASLRQLESYDVEGILGARACRLRAEAWLASDPPESIRARDELSRGVWQLGRLGAPDELGRAYLAMADVEFMLGGSSEPAAQWLARAHGPLTAHGTPADQERLRRAFRRHGRRAIDRLVDEDLEACIEGVRRGSAHAVDLLRAASGARGEGEDTRGIDAELAESVESLRDRQEQLIRSLEGALLDKERTGQLVDVVRSLFVLASEAAIDRELPALATSLGGAKAALTRVGPSGVDSISSVGSPLDLDGLLATVREVDRSGLAKMVGVGRRNVALVSIPSSRVLAVELRGGRGAPAGELERLEVLASVASAAYERARSARVIEEAAARDAATLEAIREGILTLDPEGRIRAINGAAAALIGSTRSAVEGKALAELSGLAPLAEATRRPGSGDQTVALPSNDVLVRVRRHAAGVVITLQELGKARRRALELVGSSARFTFEDLIGEDPAFLSALTDARRVSVTEAPVLITGESGTGKELMAQAIHNASPRSAHPFVGVNVAAIPRELLESELFGYERGAFTGARERGHAGRFELADRGTLLLDEIGDMPFEMQAKLLRVLQERVVTRLGGTRTVPVRARLVATTHRDLEQAVHEGTFRLDLFYRLRVVHLRLPPLRERPTDIPILLEHHLARWSRANGRVTPTVAPAVMETLMRYSWPGNVRELANLVEGIVSLLPAEAMQITELPPLLGDRRRSSLPAAPLATSAEGTTEILPLSEMERRAITQALAASDGNIAKAARALGVARGTLYNKMSRFGLR